MAPINLAEEKKLFLKKNGKYNPQFKYSGLITMNKRNKYGQPKQKYLALAHKILDKTFNNQTECEIRKFEGDKISKKEAEQMLNDFLVKNQLDEIVQVSWSDNYLGKASFYKNKLKLKTPIWHRKAEFKGTLYHELGTHALRRINYIQQPFYKKKSQLGFSDYLRTEEGLAGLHTLLVKNFKLNYTGALNYVLSELAQKESFVKVFAFVSQYIKDEERAWLYAVKHKRGLYDTSEPGGFTKDLVYFEGFVEVIKFLQENNYDLKPLYIGKIAFEDIKKAWKANPDFEPQLPHFYFEDKKSYQHKVEEIAKANLLIP